MPCQLRECEEEPEPRKPKGIGVLIRWVLPEGSGVLVRLPGSFLTRLLGGLVLAGRVICIFFQLFFRLWVIQATQATLLLSGVWTIC